MLATNPEYYWNNRSFDKTNSPYRTNSFRKIYTNACVETARIINNLKSLNTVDSDDTHVFIAQTGIDDVLASDAELNKVQSSSNCQSTAKIAMFKSIFSDHLQRIYSLPLRPAVRKNIDRMLSCGDVTKGGIMYACPDCQDYLRFSPFHCGSRFCPSCGNLYNIRRAVAMQCRVIDAPHRHVTFTIPEELRSFFRLHREALNDLFAAVADTIYYLARTISRSQAYDPGFITVLHTFGRDLKWNPHCHTLLCTKLFGNSKALKDFFLPYTVLRKSFQLSLLKRLKQRFGPVFAKLANLIYKAHPNGFYVHAPCQNVNTHSLIKYIGRYLGRPPIASSRIDSYDGQSVSFHYTRHEDDKTVSETIPALDFIKKLIIHIPETSFKMVRYFGFYSSEGAHKSKIAKFHLHPKVSSAQKKALMKNATWRFAMIQAFNVDPIKCPRCGATLLPMFASFNDHTFYYPNFKSSYSLDTHFRFLMNPYTSSA